MPQATYEIMAWAPDPSWRSGEARLKLDETRKQIEVVLARQPDEAPLEQLIFLGETVETQEVAVNGRRLFPALLLALFLTACGGGSGPAPDAVARGAKLFARSGCTVCHGLTGRGDGAGAGGLVTPPRDFTKPAEFKAARTLEGLAKADRGRQRQRLDAALPYLGDDDRRDLAAFVLSLAAAQP